MTLDPSLRHILTLRRLIYLLFWNGWQRYTTG